MTFAMITQRLEQHFSLHRTSAWQAAQSSWQYVEHHAGLEDLMCSEKQYSSSVCAAVEEMGKELSQESPKCSITWTSTAVCWAACVPSKDESTWQHMYLKVQHCWEVKAKEGLSETCRSPLRYLLFGSHVAQHQVPAGGWALGFG